MNKEGMIVLPGSKTFERHLKRYVGSPVHRFAAVLPPELSPLCVEEMADHGISKTEVSEAGIEFHGQLSDCYRANLWLRTASRILCRLPPFRAGAVEELFHRGSSFRWELWLNSRIPILIQAHVEHSRISHEGLVADTALTAVQERFRSLGMAPPGIWNPFQDGANEGGADSGLKQKVLVHLTNNRCTISLDTSGMHLHHRGYRLQHSGAPLRETLAAAILLKCGWKGDSPLVDGMCGAGTFAIEGALIARHLAPGLLRGFLFERWPAHKDKTWAYLRRMARQNALVRSKHPLLALDHNPAALAKARENARRAGLEDNIDWDTMDFFSFRPIDRNLQPGLVVLNPPYGKRLGGEGRALYERLGTHLRQWFEGWQVAVLAPSRSLATSLGISRSRFWKIMHGGIPVTVTLGRV